MRTILVGLTGGIGSGKTICADIFRQLGVEIYNTDESAKRLMIEKDHIIDQIKEIFGEEAYNDNGALNRAFLASKIFNDKVLLTTMNQIVHPAVRDDFGLWVLSKNDAAYLIQESALLFETQSYRLFDKSIIVSAPLELRIARTVNRDNVTPDQVKQRMANQWDEERKLPLADYVIFNDAQGGLIRQILDIHLDLLSLSKKWNELNH